MKTVERKNDPAGRGRRDALRQQVEELKARLAEAEETIFAIRTGAVDALVVDTPQAQRIYTLEGAERAYRVFVESIQEGALTVTREGLILYANKRFAEIAGAPLEKIIGESLLSLAVPDSRRALEALFLTGMSRGSRAEVLLCCALGKAVPVAVSITSLPESDPPALCLVISDLTERNKREAELKRHRDHLEELVRERTSDLETANAQLLVEIAERRRAEEVLAQSEHRHATTLASIGDAIIATDIEGRITFMNNVAEELTGWKSADAVTQPVTGVFKIINEQTRQAMEDPVGNVLKTGRITGLANHTLLLRKDGTDIPIDDSGAPIRSRNGDTTGVVLVFRNITERKRMEESIKAALAEKDLLMRELAHRTKNNMQVVGSLLTLQAGAVKDTKLAHALSDTQNRIRAMALVHESLYRSGNITALDIKDYVQNLVNAILAVHQATGRPIQSNLDVDKILISIDAALPCGLIINELVSNSLKHAFPTGNSGHIFLSLRCVGDKVELRYRDDGPGLPRDLDLKKVNSLGLKLVHNLAVRQLRGTMEIRHDPVSEFVIVFGGLTQMESA